MYNLTNTDGMELDRIVKQKDELKAQIYHDKTWGQLQPCKHYIDMLNRKCKRDLDIMRYCLGAKRFEKIVGVLIYDELKGVYQRLG